MTKILLVDDDSDLLSMLKIVLRSNGYSVTTLADGSATMRTINFVTPDIVILDIHMPPWDGRDICREIKSQEAYRHIPVVLYSALPEDNEAVKNCQADYFLQKPLSTGAFVEEIREVMRLREQQPTHTGNTN